MHNLSVVDVSHPEHPPAIGSAIDPENSGVGAQVEIAAPGGSSRTASSISAGNSPARIQPMSPPAAALVQVITPEANARPDAASIKAPGGGLNILNGCEGTEIMFLLIAAFAAVRLSGRRKLTGLALGLGLVFVLNQARILTLFYTFRNERSLFDILHTTILPAVLVVAVALYFYAVLHRDRLA